MDADSIYDIPLMFEEQHVGDIIGETLGLKYTKNDLDEWHDLVKKKKLSKEVEIALVGKYVSLKDAYISIYESLNHAGNVNDAKVKIRWIDSEELEKKDVSKVLKGVDGIIVPGGFGSRGIEGKINAIKYARENKIPLLGICLGMQLMVVEFMRNVANLKDANSTEFDEKTKDPVIHIMDEQVNVEDKGGTMRLGKYPCSLDVNTHSYDLYGENLIYERHRHRYEFNNSYRDLAEKNGMVIAGVSPDKRLVEIVELKDHPFAVGAQFHPELKSRPNRPHPLFRGLVKAMVDKKYNS